MKQNLLNPKKILALLTFSVGFSGLSYSQAIIRDTLFFTGVEQNYTVPCGVTNLTIDAFGASGANGAPGGSNAIGGQAGLGSHVQGRLNVSANQTYIVMVGGQGVNEVGGFNGGGTGGSLSAGGGGGATDIRMNTGIASRILVAGGGGGGGRGGCESNTSLGGNGGNGGGGAGGDGIDAPTLNGFAGGGRGGVGTQGGDSGLGCGGFLGTPGSNASSNTGGTGGNGATCCCFSFPSIPGGGGGGGGYFGGGGGGGGSAGTINCSGNDKGAGGGGAGGTNHVDNFFTDAFIENGVNNGNGFVVFSYENPIPSTPETTSFTTSFCASSNTVFEIAPVPLGTNYVWTVTGDLTIVSGQGTTSLTVTGTGNNGTISVVAENTCGSSAPSTPVTVTINQNPVLTILAGDFSVCPGEQVTLEATGADTYTWTGGIENGVSFTPTSSLSYTVTGQNTATGCSSQLSQAVTVNPVPNPTINSSLPSPFCIGVDVILTGNPAGGTFAVTTGDASALVGNTFNASTQGSWIITYTVDNPQGCTGSNTINLTTNCIVGLDKLNADNVLNVYPNPTNGKFKITSELNEKGNLQLFNQAGQLVYKKSLENLKENEIEVGNLIPGIYNLKINTASKNYTVKLNIIK